MRGISVTGLVVTGLMAMGLGFASPAQAAGTLTDNGNGTFTVASLGANERVVMCASNVPVTTCKDLSFQTSPDVALYYIYSNGTYSGGSTVTGPDDDPSREVPTPLPVGTYTIVTSDRPPLTFPFTSGASLANFTVGGGGGTSSESTPQPQTLTLSINTVKGSTCRQSSVSGIAGTWIDLPAADSCTAPASTAGATLLGWATNPNFPVEIAQRQVDNGWGAYQMLNDEERLTAVFIPAGGPTLLSGDGNLFAIWGE